MLGSAPASALLKVLPWFFSAPGQGPSQHLRLAFQALAWSSSHKHTDQAICSETLPQTLPSLSLQGEDTPNLPPANFSNLMYHSTPPTPFFSRVILLCFFAWDSLS